MKNRNPTFLADDFKIRIQNLRGEIAANRDKMDELVKDAKSLSSDNPEISKRMDDIQERLC